MENRKLNKTARATRKNIKEALLKLLETKKLDAITVMDIHQVTEYSRQTFYRHYKSVEAVYEDLIEDMFEGFVERYLTGNTITLNEFIRLFFHWAKSKMDVINLFLNAGCGLLLIRQYYTLTLNILDDVLPVNGNATEDERYRDKLVLLGSVMSMAYYWFETGFTDTPEQLAYYVESKLTL